MTWEMRQRTTERRPARVRVTGVARTAAATLMALATLAAGATAVAALQAQAQSPRKGYQVLRAFAERFTLEYPQKDWELVSGGSGSLLTLMQKKREAAVVVEYQPLHLELEPNEIDENFANLETEPINARQSEVNGVGVRLADIGGRRVVVVDFSRKGPAGTERVRQYSLPMGKHLYRLVCSAPTASFGKYDPVFATMVETFKAGAPPSSSASPAGAGVAVASPR